MRAWIISDIHWQQMESRWREPVRIPQDADVCICAGDIAENISDSVTYLRREIEPHKPVVVVLGNHDYFGSSIELA
ncbi:metallophosphoesterase family protein (plasmid) [Rhizobium sp. CB3171]|uniref:metallophosphoesterase n=1 Tax=Rhizobium sp. CB3171 TaxID=3039157 RepID=UPI0024B13CC2|nr:metallophosphoesterase family protein [Rhizobium sp. CB3171]WFU04596.1 metallophosphoesterase family protein [Rhizobium sp. CB3171]